MSAAQFHLHALSFGYRPDKLVLDGLDLTVMPGDAIAISGGNGSGKTTLLRLMVGLLKPASGVVEAFGRLRTKERDFHEVRARAGLLFQDPDDQLFCSTVMEDVAFGPLNLGKPRAEAEAIAADTLRGLGLAGFERKNTHGLSGGEKRLVSLAAVLAMEPEALLLDEPTNGLDDATRERLTQLVRESRRSKVVVSHDRAFLEAVATSELRLEDGRLRRVSPPGVSRHAQANSLASAWHEPRLQPE